MLSVSKQYILEFSRGANYGAFKHAHDLMMASLEEAMKNIMLRNSFIKSYDLVVANEAFSGADISESSIDFFLILDSLQMELNYNEKQKNKLINTIKAFWSDFRKNYKLIRRRKNSKKLIEKTEKKLLIIKDYDITNFYQDLFIQLVKLFPESTTISINKNKVTIEDKEEIGVDVNIYPVFSHDEGLYLYNIHRNKKTLINFRNRFANLDEKYWDTKQMSRVQIRILNKIFYNIFKYVPNQIFIESLVYNVPINLFTYNIYETSLNIINYLRNSTMQNFKSICDENISLFKEPLNTERYETALKFVNNIRIIS